ncbi:uL30 family ribosomal protein [Candidatus Woesearchaeota archaeon]|nr:uL30 family ribosomal protein [Candidatus Woesearchaeota archaeon]MCF7901358.1 uL30 family ribosomal protein [Candidatus Woesearchaeota archaeon]MCF8013358.1 uL30 family ribosomal protein [Candidatus Woesearchaeota archaeon]
MSEEKTIAKENIQTTEKKVVKDTEKSSSEFFAVLQVRGLINVTGQVKDTLRMLNLQNSNQLTIIPKNKQTLGMLQKCKDYITWGEINEETKKLLDEKRKTTKKYYALHPPRGGFERKGIKQPFNKGGVLGYRKEKINELIKKML